MEALFETHVFAGPQSGPRLLVLGAVHGNEVCGTIAIGRVAEELNSGRLQLKSGQLTMVPVTNRMAYDRGQRAGDRNLNRNLAPSANPQDNEDRIANALCPLLAANEVLLDLHSFHSPGEPFVMLGPQDNNGTLEPFSRARDEEALATRLGVTRAVDGWLDTYAAGAARRGGNAIYGIGTTEYMRTVGGWGVTLECGQHNDPRAPDVAEQALRRTLAHLGMIDAPAPEPAARMQMLRLGEVIDRNDPVDRFETDWTSFAPVAAGDVIGWRATGEAVPASGAGFVVFPNQRAEPGTEWFYFAKAHARLEATAT